MGYTRVKDEGKNMEIEIFAADENGAGWESLSELSDDKRISLEVEVDLAAAGLSAVKILCVACMAEIPRGTGSYCSRHKPNYPECAECGNEQQGLYCHHCYTGRILTSPSGERYSEHR